MLTDSDRHLLRKASFIVLSNEFDLAEALLHLDSDGNLAIFCHTSTEAAQLLDRLDLVKERAYEVVGCWYLTIWFAGGEVWQGLTRPLPEGFNVSPCIAMQLESESIAFEAHDMTAVLDRPTEVTQANGTATTTATTEQFFPIEAIAQNLTSLTNLPVDQLVNIILSTRPLMRWEDGIYKAPASAGASAFRQWAAEIEAKLAQGELSQPSQRSAPVSSPQAKPAAKPKATAKKTTAKKTSTRRTAPKAAEA